MKKKWLIIPLLILVYYLSYIFYGKDKMILDIVNNEEIEFYKDKQSINIFIFDNKLYSELDEEIKSVYRIKGFKEVNIYHDKTIPHNENLNYSIQVEDELKLFPFLIFSRRALSKAPEYINDWECIYIWFFYKWVRIYRHDILLI